jgi:hypothetical protein
MKTVILTSCNNSFEAKIIQGNLANEGIESMISNENYTSLYPNMNGSMGSGIQVFVDEADVEKSMHVIKANDWRAHCPSCNSLDVALAKLNLANNIKRFFLSAVTFTPFGNMKTTFHCNGCGKNFEI